jgi:Apea-like HEPN
MSQQRLPYFSFLPFLPLSNTIPLGEWNIGVPDSGVSWCTPRFKELANTHLASFEKLGFPRGALMWHRERGFDGSKPDDKTLAAIRATITFVGLDANDLIRPTQLAAHNFVTSENTELYIQPIDEIDGNITLERGGPLKAVISAGSRIGEGATYAPDTAVAITSSLSLSKHLATATFDALMDTEKDDNLKIRVALRWHRQALSNSRAIELLERIVFLKTGFEAITGESSTPKCGKKLRTLFEETTGLYAEWLPWSGILWSPKERTNLERHWKDKAEIRSELQDWFQTFGDARNKIVHEGSLSNTAYHLPERPLSRYGGHLFQTADRLLRETIKAKLGVEILLCGLLKNMEAWNLFIATFSPIASTTDDSRLSLNESSRDLLTLLRALECTEPAKVVLQKAIGHTSPTAEGARENAAHAIGRWGASCDGIEILVNEVERDTLAAAGAEYPLPEFWEPCE